MYSSKNTLLLDMNSTFMFGEDKFSLSEDFSKYYHEIGGSLEKDTVNQIIRSVYDYLSVLYPDEKYRHKFPTLKEAIRYSYREHLPEDEIEKIIKTFSFHEIGYIPKEYIEVLHQLSEIFQLAVVIDIWSPKLEWISLFKKIGINKLFSASSFSSDHGMVKPSPKPFELVVKALGVKNEQCLVIGDSERRDLGGAIAAGIDCVLVGGAKNSKAIECYENLLEFTFTTKNT
jgi:HAD superfamily hydrolase (TIGR01549 family)